MELNKIIIGVLFTSLISVTFLYFISSGVAVYNPSSVPADYADSFERINTNIDDISVIANETEESLDSLSSSSNIVGDFIGFFFGNGYKAVKTLISSITLTNVIVQEGVKNTLGVSSLSGVFISVFLTVIVIILLAILLHFVIKSERV